MALITLASASAIASYFNSRHVINVEGIQAIEFLPTPQDPLESSSVQVEVTDGKLTVDAEGGNNTKINFLKIAPAQAVIDTRVNFQPEGALVPEGYTPDFGKAFSEEQGFGWITQASVGEVSTPLDISPNARDRNALDSQRLDTFIHMQYPTNANNSTAVKTPAAWEYTLPNGTYSVSVVVGDPRAFDSTHVINVEGVSAIDSFVPTSADPFEIATVEVEVTDGELTLDAIGGNNTKINYVSISSVASGFTTLNWSTVKPSPIGRVEAFGAAADGKLYVFGGFIDTTFYPTTRSNVYNPTTNTWAQIAPCPNHSLMGRRR